MSNHELYEHKTSDRIKWIISFTLIAVLFLGMFASLYLTLGKNVEDEQDKTEAVIAADEPIISLNVSPLSVTALASTGQTVSKRITATVLPEDAPNKAVDWTIVWCEPISGKEVTEYLTVTPDSDGSLTATITAHKGFDGGSAYVIATTRVGKFSAQCLIKYEGVPQTMSFTCNGTEYTNTQTLTAEAGSTYSLSINLNNVFGAVGSKYGDFEITHIKGQGKFNMTKEYIVNASVSSTEEIVYDLESGITYTHEVSGEQETFKIDTDKFLTATIEGDVLNINAIQSETSYVNGYPRTGYRFTYKSEYYDPRGGGVPSNCIWYIVVEDTVSGVTALINVDIVTDISAVSLSATEIAF